MNKLTDSIDNLTESLHKLDIGMRQAGRSFNTFAKRLSIMYEIEKIRANRLYVINSEKHRKGLKSKFLSRNIKMKGVFYRVW